jgi:iron complex outermembrane receptor protein
MTDRPRPFPGFLHLPAVPALFFTLLSLGGPPIANADDATAALATAGSAPVDGVGEPDGGVGDGGPPAASARAPVPVATPAPPAAVAPVTSSDAPDKVAPGAVAGAAIPSAATAAAAPPPSGDSAQLGTVVVTGVRGSKPRTVADSPVPIDVIGPEQLQATGRTGLKEILGNLIPSLTMPAQGGGGTSASVRPISIRGLSGDYVLVLVNGKRRHTTSLINNLSRISGGSTPVDIDLIATSAVGRIEVLRDGAAAQYGSDAISGVINIILDRDPNALTFSETGGSTYTKGGALLQQTLSLGVPLGHHGGFVRFAVEGKFHDHTKSSASPLPALRPNGQPNYFYPPAAVDTPDPREAAASGNVFAGGYGRSNRDIILNTSYNAELPLGQSLRLYSFSTLSYRDIKDARGAYPANNINSLPEVYPRGFQAYRRIKEWDFQPTVGVKGTEAEWDWDLSSSFGRDHVRLSAENTLNPSLGPTTPTSFFMGKQIQDLWVSNLDISKAISAGWRDPLELSFGLEHRWERFQNVAGEPDSYRDGGYVIPIGSDPFHQAPLPGGIGGYGGLSPSPGLASFTGTSYLDARHLRRNNVAAYLDVGSKILPRWYVGLAGRVEHYDDSAGNTVSGKLSTRFEIISGLALRGGINSGFRAPSLAQTGFSTTQNTVTIIGADRVLTTSKFLPVDSPAALALGARPLRPEKSLNFTGGITFEPANALRVTVDGYQINVDDRIVKTEFLGTSNNGGAAIRDILVANGVTGVDSAQFFTNAIDSRTRGVDIVGEYTFRAHGAGTFRPSAAYSYATTRITHLADNPSELSNLSVVLFGRQAQRDLVQASPKDKLVLDLDWAIWRLRTNLRHTRYGSYTESGTTADGSGDRTFGDKWITDLDVAYDLTDHFTAAIGANNLFDVYPDRNGIIFFQDGSGQYGSFSPFGLSGGFYYARLAGNF